MMLEDSKFIVRKKLIRWMWNAFYGLDSKGEKFLFARQDIEGVRVFSDKGMKEEVLKIRSRHVPGRMGDFAITDTAAGEFLGAFAAKKSGSRTLSDWAILNAEGQDIGSVTMTNKTFGVMHRILANRVPLRYTVLVRGAPVCEYCQRSSAIPRRMEISFSRETNDPELKLLTLAGAILLGNLDYSLNGCLFPFWFPW